MRRRDAVAGLLALGALSGVRVAGAQAAKVNRIGILGPLSAAEGKSFIQAFLRGMRERGYDTGKELVLIERYADGKIDKLPVLVAELVQLKVDLLFTSTFHVLTFSPSV